MTKRGALVSRDSDFVIWAFVISDGVAEKKGRMPVGPTVSEPDWHLMPVLQPLILVWINHIAPGHRHTDRTQYV